MKVLFAAEEHAWGGILNKFRHALPDVEFVQRVTIRHSSCKVLMCSSPP